MCLCIGVTMASSVCFTASTACHYVSICVWQCASVFVCIVCTYMAVCVTVCMCQSNTHTHSVCACVHACLYVCYGSWLLLHLCTMHVYNAFVPVYKTCTCIVH